MPPHSPGTTAERRAVAGMRRTGDCRWHASSWRAEWEAPADDTPAVTAASGVDGDGAVAAAGPRAVVAALFVRAPAGSRRLCWDCGRC